MKRGGLIILLLLNIFKFYPQKATDDNFLKFVDKANEFMSIFPQEKVYLHLDNSSYYLNETIWFKAYLVSSDLHLPSPISNTLYVELLSPEGDIVKKSVYKVTDGQAHGELYLDNRLMKSGFYEIRAYTRYMLNFDGEEIFSRVLPIYEQPSKEGNYSEMRIKRPSVALPSKREKGKKLKKINITFFPEGGNLVVGLPSKVAFKATDGQGRNVDVEGIIYNSRKEEITRLKTIHQGMGAFFFIPDNEEYTAVITWDGKEHNIRLPKPQLSGYVMNLNKDNEFIKVGIFQKDCEQNDTLAVVAMCGGRSYLFKTIAVGESDKHIVRFPVKELPGGVNEILLFDKEGKALASRLIFIESKNFLVMSQEQDKPHYKPHEKITMDFEIKDQLGNPVETSFSLSVRDQNSMTKTSNIENIMVNLLLSSDLKGYIENPSYYFELEGKDRALALDLLLMTQGWRQYKWEQLTAPDGFKLVHNPEKGISVDGKVFSWLRSTPKKNVDLTLLLKSENKTLVEAGKSDSLGRFNFSGDLYGNWDALIQTKEKNKKKDYRVMLDRLFSPKPKTYSFYDTQVMKYLKPSLAEENKKLSEDDNLDLDTLEDSLSNKSMTQKNHILSTVVVKGKRKSSDANDALSKADIVYDVDTSLDAIVDAGDYVGDDIFEFLKKTNPNFTLYYIGASPVYRYLTYPVTFIIDGESLARSGWSTLQQIPLGMIEKVSISRYRLSSPDDYSEAEANIQPSELVSVTDEGIDESLDEDGFFQFKDYDVRKEFKEKVYVYLYTYKDGQYRASHKGIRKAVINGYALTKDFYSPNYESLIFPDEYDSRRTLYWSPDVKTDSLGKAKVVFYNNSASRNMNINAETITKDGIIGVLEK